MRANLRIVIALVMLSITAALGSFSSTSQAAEKSPPSGILTIIDTAFKAFNAGDAKLWAAGYAPNAVIVDEISPYRWEGPNAAAQWWADYAKWAKANMVTKGRITHDAIKFWVSSNGRMYLVAPSTFAALQNGKPIVETGNLTFTFVKVGEGWKTEGWTWGTISQR